MAEERRRFEILKRELEEIEARRREQAAAKEARKVREAELRAVRMENKRLERRVRRERVAFENKARRAARGPRRTTSVSPHGARVQRKRRGRRGTGTTRGFGGETRGAKRRRSGGGCLRTRPGGVRTKTRDGDVFGRRAIRSVPRRRRRAPRHSFVEFRRRGSEPSPGQTRRRVPRRSTRGDASEPRRAAEIAVSAPPRGERSRGATSTPAGGAGKGPSPKTREDVRRDGEGSTPPARQRTRAARGGDARGRHPTRVRRSLPHRPARTGVRARRTNTTSTDAASPGISSTRRDGSTSGPRPRANRCPRRGRVPIGTTRARAREKQLARDATTMRTTTGTTGTTVSSGTTGTTGTSGTTARASPRTRRFTRRRWTTSTTIRGWRARTRPRATATSAPANSRERWVGSPSGRAPRESEHLAPQESEHLAPRESEHLAPRESEHLAASLGGKGFRTALRERQLAAVEARRAANAGDGGDDDDVGIPRVNAYQAVDDTPCVGAQTFSATKGLVGLEDVEGGFDAAAGGTSPRGTRTTTRLGDGRGGREGRGRRETVRKGGEGGEG